MTTGPTTETADAPVDAARSKLVIPLVVLALAGWTVWLWWRVPHVDLTPVAFVAFLVELAGWSAGLLVISGLTGVTGVAGGGGAPVPVDGPARYAMIVAERTGGIRCGEIRTDLRTAASRARRGRLTPTDRAMLGVSADGARRLVIVLTLAFGLLVGTAPMPVPPWWALASVLAGSACSAGALMRSAGGAIRPGDRTRWSYASLGELVSAADRRDVAPRSWVGTVAVIVVLSLAIALRGVSDRWTHGLPAMTDAERLVTMTWAAALVAGALFTLRTIPSPQLGNAHLVARRMEERTARRSAIGAALGAGMIGLLAGVLPGGVDAADDQPTRVEPVAETEIDTRG